MAARAELEQQLAAAMRSLATLRAQAPVDSETLRRQVAQATAERDMFVAYCVFDENARGAEESQYGDQEAREALNGKATFQMVCVCRCLVDMCQMPSSKGGVDINAPTLLHMLTLSTVHMCTCIRP